MKELGVILLVIAIIVFFAYTVVIPKPSRRFKSSPSSHKSKARGWSRP